MRDEVRERVVEAANAELDTNAEVDTTEADLAVRNLDERLHNTKRYDDVISLPLTDAVNAILADLGLDPRRTGEALPLPDPPPRMTRAP